MINGQAFAMPLGSGFFVSQNVFLTCYHVVNTIVSPHQQGDRYQLVNNFGNHGTQIMIDPADIGTNIHLQADSDLALLQVAAAPANQHYVVLDFGDMPPGMEIGVAGYPLARLRADANGTLQYDGLVYRVSKGVVNSAFQQNIQPMNGDPAITQVDTAEVNFLFVPGNSGGPIFDSDTGRVYAFVHGFRAEKIGEHYFDTTPSNIALGATAKHIEALHAIYSVGIRLTKARPRLLSLGVGL